MWDFWNEKADALISKYANKFRQHVSFPLLGYLHLRGWSKFSVDFSEGVCSYTWMVSLANKIFVLWFFNSKHSESCLFLLSTEKHYSAARWIWNYQIWFHTIYSQVLCGFPKPSLKLRFLRYWTPMQSKSYPEIKESP